MLTPEQKAICDAAMSKRIAALANLYLRTIPRTSLPEWADAYRKLSSKSSARPGDFVTGKVEAARGPMHSVNEPGVEIITLMVATQLLKTTLIENIIGYFAHVDPCPILAVYPNESAAQAFSKERLSPMIAATPVLRERVGNVRSRKSENTIDVKHFPGGFIAMVSAGSPMDLSARPIRIVLEDEIDKYAPTKEGDPISLAEERSSTFPKRLAVRACSPTTEETSRIYQSYLSSDQRRPYVECPHCGHWQYLDFFRHVHWERRGTQHMPNTAAIFCEKCGAAWTEQQRRETIQHIEYRQTATFLCCGEGQDPRMNRLWEWDEENQVGYALCAKCKERAIPNRHAGFTCSKLYSPFLTMVQLAAKWLEVKDDPEQRQTFYNTQLAIPYKSEITKDMAAKTIAARRENWDKIPNKVVVLTAGVDVQSGQTGSIGRLELELVGWDPYEESWSVDYVVFMGDPAQREVWQELDDYLLRQFEREDGRKMKIMGCCIDSGGHHTEEVYKFCLARMGRNVWATKGASDRSGQWSPVWPVIAMRKHRQRRHRPVIIGVNAAKEAIRQRLLIDAPGPGYCHFPAGRPSAYFDQITSEKLVLERKAGITMRKWILTGHQANEALDARVLAYAALQGIINDRGFKMMRVARILAGPTPSSADMEVPDEPEEELDDAQDAVDTEPEDVRDVAVPAREPVRGPPRRVPSAPPLSAMGRMAVRNKVVSTRSSYMSRRHF